MFMPVVLFTSFTGERDMEPSELFCEVTTEELTNAEYHGVSAEIVSNSRLSVFRRNPQEYYQRYVTKEIPDEDTAALAFGRVFHEAILERKTEVTQENVLLNSLGIFRACSTPPREPDIDHNDEQIWFADIPEQGVVRRSKWWGEMGGGRTWLLSPERGGHIQTGYCAFDDMLIDGDHFYTVRSEVLSKAGRRQGDRWDEFLLEIHETERQKRRRRLEDQRSRSLSESTAMIPFVHKEDDEIALPDVAAPAAYKPAEWFDLLSMRRELRAHPLSRQILFGPHGANRRTEFSIRAVDRETGITVQTRLDFCRQDCDGVLVVDLKSSRDASPSAWNRQAEKDGLHVQAAIQIGLAQLYFGSEVAFRFCVVQKDAPFRVEVFELEPEFIEIGVEDYLRDIRRFAECVNSGVWQPKSYGEVQMLKTPNYRMLDRQLAWHKPDGTLGFYDDES